MDEQVGHKIWVFFVMLTTMLFYVADNLTPGGQEIPRTSFQCPMRRETFKCLNNPSSFLVHWEFGKCHSSMIWQDSKQLLVYTPAQVLDWGFVVSQQGVRRVHDRSLSYRT